MCTMVGICNDMTHITLNMYSCFIPISGIYSLCFAHGTLM